MKIFTCQACGNAVYFDNTVCMSCGHRLGYLPGRFEMSAVELAGDRFAVLADPSRTSIFCENAGYDACNWMIDPTSSSRLCLACQHNRMVPDLSDADNVAAWRKLELSKRHLFYSLMRWRLPLPLRSENDEGLVFDFLSDTLQPDGSTKTVMTGHDNGLITINLAEADDAERERRRTDMGEPYRTVLGHMRHEIGHFYWDRLVRDGGRIGGFRALFGDESIDYGDALQRHYQNGPRPDWPAFFISAYATAHPWEDFAETWAHYLHMVDGLETANAYGMRIRPNAGTAEETKVDFDPYREMDFQRLLEAWIPLTVALNSLNRSLGQPDTYPFVLTEAITNKLLYIHELVRAQ